MIHFWWSRVLEHPAIADLDYYCRLDTDSFFVDPVPQDIFKVMQENHYTYGYRYQHIDYPEVVDGMWQFVAEYLESHSAEAEIAGRNGLAVPSPSQRSITPVGMYYNNFEVR